AGADGQGRLVAGGSCEVLELGEVPARRQVLGEARQCGAGRAGAEGRHAHRVRVHGSEKRAILQVEVEHAAPVAGLIGLQLRDFLVRQDLARHQLRANAPRVVDLILHGVERALVGHPPMAVAAVMGGDYQLLMTLAEIETAGRGSAGTGRVCMSMKSALGSFSIQLLTNRLTAMLRRPASARSRSVTAA